MINKYDLQSEAEQYHIDQLIEGCTKMMETIVREENKKGKRNTRINTLPLIHEYVDKNPNAMTPHIKRDVHTPVIEFSFPEVQHTPVYHIEDRLVNNYLVLDKVFGKGIEYYVDSYGPKNEIPEKRQMYIDVSW